MKTIRLLITFLLLMLIGCGCTQTAGTAQVATTTLPIYEFTSALCEGTGITVTRLVNEEVSCLHDYSLQTRQMRAIEGADILVISGGGLEAFLDGALNTTNPIIDASAAIELHCSDAHDHHNHDGHNHEKDPHIWLSPDNAKTMVHNICHGLIDRYPQHEAIFHKNEEVLTEKLNTLQLYGQEQLKDLSCRKLVTFHDGFAYLAEAFQLSIVKAVEEESGSEASAAELIEIINLVKENQLPAIFTEHNGSVSAAEIISAETGVKVYQLDMAMAGDSYFDAMYHNIDTLKEALG